jgi:DUF4097 and DUF4098 domain-containing protein YvlB
MSWLYTIVIAGLMFSADGFPVENKAHSYTNTTVSQTVNLDETERFEQVYQLNPNGRVSVSNVNGSVTVEAWDNPQVKLEAVKISDSRESLSEVEIKVDAQANSFRVEAEYESGRNRGGDKNWKIYKKLEVEFRLMVPRTAFLDEIETVNGSVTVSNFTNYTKISAVNGNVNATNLRGTANLSTVNGTVEADFDRLEQGSKISLETVNGRVNLTIPSDSNATMKADTVNGSIKNDFGLPVRKGEYVGKDLYGRIGNGEVQIKLSSVNGGLLIARKNDGKTPNQPTNLLNTKNSDEDWDDEGFAAPVPPVPPVPPIPPTPLARINTAKMNKEISRAVKESQKDVEAAMKEAAEELENLEPELKELAEAEVLNSEQMKESLKQAKIAQKDALARLGEMNFASAAPIIEKKSETFTVKGTPKVTINANNCDVSVRGWDRSEVQYVVKKFSRNRNQSNIESKASQNDSEVKITVESRQLFPQTEDYYEGENNTRIEVFVPKKSNLKIVTNGEIRLENVSGDIDLDGADEAINIRDVEGKLQLIAADARVRVIGFRGELNARTVDGDVYLEGDFSKISAKSTDGNYILTLPDNANAVIGSNTEVETNRFKLVKDGDQIWRAGKGGGNYNFHFADGKLIVRSESLIEND